MSYESQANEIYERFFEISKDAKQAKESAVFMATNLMRHGVDKLFWAKVLLKLEETIL
jgi:Mn-containing catalase